MVRIPVSPLVLSSCELCSETLECSVCQFPHPYKGDNAAPSSFGERGSKGRCEQTVLGTEPGTRYVFSDYSVLFFSFPSKTQAVGAGGLSHTVPHLAEAEAVASPPQSLTPADSGFPTGSP